VQAEPRTLRVVMLASAAVHFMAPKGGGLVSLYPL